MSDAWADLNRRAAAVPGGVPWQNGLVLDDGPENAAGDVVVPGLTPDHGCGLGPDYLSGTVWTDEQRAQWVPDLRSPATRGILRAALGSPSVLFHDGRPAGGDVRCRIRDVAGYGSTREQAEAAALVALAEARGQWGPG